MSKHGLKIFTVSMLFSVLPIAVSSAKPYTGPHNFTQQEYVTIRSLQVCINRQGFEYSQDENDALLKQILKEKGIKFSFEKLTRENYKYEHGVRGSIKAEVEYDINEAVKRCMGEKLVSPYPEDS